MKNHYTFYHLKKLSSSISGTAGKMAALFFACIFLVSALNAGVVTVLATDNSTSGNGRAPQGTRSYINTIYLISPSEMTASGYGADNITSVGWTWNNPLGAGAPSTQSVATTGTLKIYMQNTTDVSYTKGTTFSTAGMTKVFDGTITIPATAAQIMIDVVAGGPGTSTFTTVAGQGVYLAFEYHTTTSLATPIGAPTVATNTALTGSLGTYQSQTVYGTSMTLSAFRPETRFGTANTDMIQVSAAYTLGTTAAIFGNPQPLQAYVKNVDVASHTFNVDFNVYEKATMTLRHSNSVSTTLAAGASGTVDDLTWNATLTELDTVIMSVTPLAGETVTSNNSKGYRHNVTAENYNYADLSTSTGGVGYGVGEGLILNRYHISGCSNVPQVSIYMGDANSAFDTIYAVVMNSAGTIVGTSAEHVILPFEIYSYLTLDITSPPNFTNEDVYVGLAQLASPVAYYPVGTQAEPFPARSNAYYATGLAGGVPLAYTTLGRWMIDMVITPYSTTPETSGDVTICQGSSTDLSVIGGILNPYATLQWYTDGCGTTSAGSGSTITVSPTTTTTYYVRAEDPCNGQITSCGSLTVTVEIPTTFYADTDGDGYGDAAAPSLFCDAPAGYVADNTDCDDTHSTVYPGATEICDGLDNNCNGEYDENIVNATISPVGSVATCKGILVNFSTETCAGCTYQWFKNDNVIAGATSPTFSTDKPAYYNVQVTIPEGCFDLSDHTLLTTNPNPTANIFTPNGTSLCTTVKLKASYDASYTFQWNLGGSPIGGATAYIYYATTPGSYNCTITNGFGCTRTTASVNVTACREGDLDEVNAIGIYPNPTTGEFMLDANVGSTADHATIMIYNSIGEVVYSTATGIEDGMIHQTIQLDQNIAAGVYFVQVNAGDNFFNSRLIIAE